MSTFTNYNPTAADTNNVFGAVSAAYGINPYDLASASSGLNFNVNNLQQYGAAINDLAASMAGVAAQNVTITAANTTGGDGPGTGQGIQPGAGGTWFGDWFKTNSANAIAVVAGVIMFGLGGYGLMARGD